MSLGAWQVVLPSAAARVWLGPVGKSVRGINGLVAGNLPGLVNVYIANWKVNQLDKSTISIRAMASIAV